MHEHSRTRHHERGPCGTGGCEVSSEAMREPQPDLRKLACFTRWSGSVLLEVCLLSELTHLSVILPLKSRGGRQGSTAPRMHAGAPLGLGGDKAGGSLHFADEVQRLR